MRRILFLELDLTFLDDTDLGPGSVSGAQVAAQRIIYNCTSELETNADWSSLPVRCVLDFVSKAFELGQDLVTAAAVAQVVNWMATSNNLILENNVREYLAFCLVVLPRIDTIRDVDRQELQRASQQLQARKNADQLRPDQEHAIGILLDVIRPSPTAAQPQDVSAGPGYQNSSDDGASRDASLADAEASLVEGIRHIHIDDSEHHFGSSDAGSQSQGVQDEEQAAAPHDAPSKPQTLDAEPGFCTEEDPDFYGADKLAWQEAMRRPDPSAHPETDADFSIFDEESNWSPRTVMYLVEEVCKKTMIYMSLSDENTAYAMFAAMIASKNLFIGTNLQSLSMALFLKAGILDTMAGGYSVRLTAMFDKLFERGYGAKATHRQKIQDLCEVLGRDEYKYTKEEKEKEQR